MSIETPGRQEPHRGLVVLNHPVEDVRLENGDAPEP